MIQQSFCVMLSVIVSVWSVAIELAAHRDTGNISRSSEVEQVSLVCFEADTVATLCFVIGLAGIAVREWHWLLLYRQFMSKSAG